MRTNHVDIDYHQFSFEVENIVYDHTIFLIQIFFSI